MIIRKTIRCSIKALFRAGRRASRRAGFRRAGFRRAGYRGAGKRVGRRVGFRGAGRGVAIYIIISLFILIYINSSLLTINKLIPCPLGFSMLNRLVWANLAIMSMLATYRTVVY